MSLDFTQPPSNPRNPRIRIPPLRHGEKGVVRDELERLANLLETVKDGTTLFQVPLQDLKDFFKEKIAQFNAAEYSDIIVELCSKEELIQKYKSCQSIKDYQVAEVFQEILDSLNRIWDSSRRNLKSISDQFLRELHSIPDLVSPEERFRFENQDLITSLSSLKDKLELILDDSANAEEIYTRCIPHLSQSLKESTLGEQDQELINFLIRHLPAVLASRVEKKRKLISQIQFHQSRELSDKMANRILSKPLSEVFSTVEKLCNITVS